MEERERRRVRERVGGGCGELAGREESTSENSNRSGEKQKGLLEFLREREIRDGSPVLVECM